MKILIIISAAIVLASCGSTSKFKRSTDTSIDSTVLKEKENLIRDAREKIAYLENELREAQLTGFEFNNCDTAAWQEIISAIRRSSDSLTKKTADSLIWAVESLNKKYSNTVKFYADGSAEASGALKAANYSKTVLQKQLTYYMDKSDSLAYELETEKKNVKIEVRDVVKEKKVTRFPWWLIIAAAIGGLIVGVKYSKQIKFFISKFKT